MNSTRQTDLIPSPKCFTNEGITLNVCVCVCFPSLIYEWFSFYGIHVPIIFGSRIVAIQTHTHTYEQRGADTHNGFCVYRLFSDWQHQGRIEAKICVRVCGGGTPRTDLKQRKTLCSDKIAILAHTQTQERGSERETPHIITYSGFNPAYDTFDIRPIEHKSIE